MCMGFRPYKRADCRCERTVARGHAAASLGAFARPSGGPLGPRLRNCNMASREWMGSMHRRLGTGGRLGLVLGLLVVVSGIIVTEPGTRAAAPSLTPHNPILIQSDADFTAANGVVGGSG